MDVQASNTVFIYELEIWSDRTRESLICGTVGPRNRTKGRLLKKQKIQ